MGKAGTVSSIDMPKRSTVMGKIDSSFLFSLTNPQAEMLLTHLAHV